MTIDNDRLAQDSDIEIFMKHKLVLRENDEIIGHVKLLVKTITPTLEIIEGLLSQHLCSVAQSIVSLSEQYSLDPQIYLSKLPSKESQANCPHMKLYKTSLDEFILQIQDVLKEVEDNVQLQTIQMDIQPYDIEKDTVSLIV